MSGPKMMPGQVPYSLAELSKLLELVGQAATAEEVFGAPEAEAQGHYELEQAAEQARRTGKVPEPSVD